MYYYLCEKSPQGFDAGVKARSDVTEILDGLEDWGPIWVHRCWDQRGLPAKLRAVAVNCADWARVLARVGRGDVLLVQYPLAMFPKVALTALPFIDLIRRRGCRVAFLVHDLDSFRGQNSSSNDMRFLRRADVVIAHNARMAAELARRGISAPVVTLDIFDYLVEGDLPACDEGIDVAGNLNRGKAGYLYRVAREAPELPLNLYGANFDGSLGTRCRYMGAFASDELPEHMVGKFGLVWDGESLATCSGEYGEYLVLNSPHKLSLYLALGKPVFIWSGAAQADLVRASGVGFAVDSVPDAEKLYNDLDEETYAAMRTRAIELSERLRSGCFTKRALSRALEALGIGGE